MFNRFKINEKGFGLVEILVSISVFLTGLVAIIIIFGRVISPFPYIATRMEASYLAKEGIELVRNRRDENWLEGRDWKNGLDNVMSTISIFNREVNVTNVNNYKIKIESTVFWTLRGEQHSIEIESYLYNWY